MSYDKTKLEKEVRIYLGDMTEEKLPERIIFQFADLHDVNPLYTSSQPHLLWKTTLSCLDYLMATTATSSGAAKSTRKEKIGGVEITVSEDNSSGTSIQGFKDLYAEYENSPEKFGINPDPTISVKTGPVIISGTNYPKLNIISSNLSKVRCTSIYNR